MRYADRPIRRPGDDLLERAPFARELANAIDRLEVARDGFVMAILGPWGSGKTSVVELIIRYLRHIEMERMSHTTLLGDEIAAPLALDQIEPLALAFEEIQHHFDEEEERGDLSLADTQYRRGLIRSWVDTDEAAARADHYWRLRLKVARDPHTVVVRFSPWLIAGHAQLADALLSDLARVLGPLLPHDINESFISLLTRIAEFAPTAGAAASMIPNVPGVLISTGGSVGGKVAARMAAGRTLDQIRERLRTNLGKISSPRILAVIDDLDRLTPAEAVEMMALIKSLGDLPNVIYLLSYDEQRMFELIHLGLKVNGNRYLDKIVQYKIHLPAPDQAALRQLFEADLSDLVDDDLDEADKRRLGSTWYFFFSHYLRTPRDVRMLANSLAVSVPALKASVDVIDLVLLDLLKTFEPELYVWVRSNIARLTD